MTDKELRKLSREDLLQLLIMQGHEAATTEGALKEAKYNEQRQFESNERLRDKLNDREETIEHLKEKLASKDAKLNEKDERIAALEMEVENLKKHGIAIDSAGIIEGRPIGSIAECACVIADIFNKAQQAADMYLANAKKIAEGDNA